MGGLLSPLFRHRRYRDLLLLSLLLLGGLLLPGVSLAQGGEAVPYWQYSAASRLSHVIPVNLNDDNDQELLVADEAGRVALLNAGGNRQWVYDAQAPITAVAPFRYGQNRQPAILLGTRNQLHLLTNTGELLWQQPLTAVTPPPALLAAADETAALAWLEQYPAIPTAIHSIRPTADAPDDILVLLQSGQLLRLDGDGRLQWRHSRYTNPSLDAHPHLLLADLDGDGQEEILLGSFNPRRFSQMLLLDQAGNLVWEQNISGRLNALTSVTFNGVPYVAVGNSRGEILLYDADRQRLWLRTLNKPITSLISAALPDGPALIAGTDSGVLVAYDQVGQRIWTRILDPEAGRRLDNLTAVSGEVQETRPFLSLILGGQNSLNEPADVLLLNGDGRVLQRFAAIDTTELSRLLDVNNDGQYELLLARFATVELLGLGSGSSNMANEWSYSSLFAAPTGLQLVDFDRDGDEEILISAGDGRLHRLDNDGSLRWIAEPGGQIDHLEIATTGRGELPFIVVIHNDRLPGPGNQVEGVIELRQANGDEVWQQEIPAAITAVLVDQLEANDAPEIIVGAQNGDILVYDINGKELWRNQVDGRVQQLLVQPNRSLNQPELLAVSQNLVYRVPAAAPPAIMIAYPADITKIYKTIQSNTATNTALMTLGAQNAINGFNWRGVPLPQWPFPINGQPAASRQIQPFIEDFNPSQAIAEAASDALIVATSNGDLLNFTLISDTPTLAWKLTDLPNVTSIYWGDLDGDGLPETVIGDRSGNVLVYNSNLEIISRLNVLSSVFALESLTSRNATAGLLVVTENGLVQLFRARENRPPLLTNPRLDILQERYEFGIMVQDVERDEVSVRLELFDSESDNWLTVSEQRINGSGALLWPDVAPPPQAAAMVYRFRYDDGYHTGVITPPPGPLLPLPAPPQPPYQLIPAALALAGLVVLVYSVRQIRTPAARARRFYGRLQQAPTQTLELLEKRYAHTAGAPEFLLHLANQARQQGDWVLSSLVDGLFLLPSRPQSGLSLVNNALLDAAQKSPQWAQLARWTTTFRVGQLLFDAPTITELGLLQPQALELAALLEMENRWAAGIEALPPILANLRDSERVERSDDRLVYLNEANLQVGLLRSRLAEFDITIERALVHALVKRWAGLLSAEIEELRGQADLSVELQTRRLSPHGRTDVVLEITNVGRAPAENILVMLAENPAYLIHSDPRIISSLPPGRTWQVSFTLEPRVSDRFRLALTITFDDRNKRDKEIAFADMVQLIVPLRDFKPIANPYLPGTPLRQDSMLFYGREDQFNFIAENAGRVAQRNVLIFIGQRRTGKTSFLLRLQQHLPQNLLPVYIDCQSLGVIPGMPALLHDLAWQIADALATRGLELTVPEPDVWQDEPTIHFQRRFLPQVRALLPPGTILLLVFDEFEAFENLVNDGILPPTFFTYMRHLMQHSDGLSFIFVGTRRLEAMSADYWSVLFNIALYQKIGFLNEEAMTRLITDPVAPNLLYDDLALAKIRRVTAGHPYFLQLVCYTLVKQANARRASYITISDVNAALEEMMRLGEVHFAYLWQRSTFAERALLTAVAHLMDSHVLFHPEDLLAYLEAYGIELTPTAVTTALTSLVEREIMAEVTEDVATRYELKIGLVGLWTARNKSLSKLHVEQEQAQQRPRAELAL